MPHISKRKVSDGIRYELNKRLLDILQRSKSKNGRYLIIDLLTKTEKLMLAKRLLLIILINENYSVVLISKLLKISTSTVLRFRHNIHSGLHKEIIEVINKKSSRKIIDSIFYALSLPFELQHKSFNKVTKNILNNFQS